MIEFVIGALSACVGIYLWAMHQQVKQTKEASDGLRRDLEVLRNSCNTNFMAAQNCDNRIHSEVCQIRQELNSLSTVDRFLQ